MTITWWHWLALGLILVALELAASGGFYVIFFGIAAIAIGGLHLFDIAGPVWMQLLLFSVIAVASLLLFRNPLLHWLQLGSPGSDVDSLVGETAFPIEDIPPGAVGRAELRGTVWSARNISSGTLPRGGRCRVVKVDRLIIHIESERPPPDCG
jgi:membrane protein implicated in regulation of membrane protease activity